MKILLKILLFLGLFISSVSAEIDERQIDLYFANGMFGGSEEKEETTWEEYVKVLKASNPKVAYNSYILWEPDNECHRRSK